MRSWSATAPSRPTATGTASIRRPTAPIRASTCCRRRCSYVTGTHTLKTGVQWGFGHYITGGDLNGDLIQLYRNGRPDSVRVYNTPRQAQGVPERGPRHLRAGLVAHPAADPELRRAASSTSTARSPSRTRRRAASCRRALRPRSPCMPCWFDVTPRLGVAYDLFGNARTALKAQRQQVHGRPDARLRAALQPVLVAERRPDLDRSATATTSRRTARSARSQQRALRPGGSDQASRSRTSAASTTGNTAPASSTSCCAACR